MATTEITKIQLPDGNNVTFCDNVAREAARAGVELVKVPSLPTATAQTKGKIYLLSNGSLLNENIYDEYVTVETVDGGNSTYSWEKIGTTETDLSDYSKKTHTHSVTSNVTLTGASYTPAGTVSAPTISVKNTSNQVADLYSMSSAGSYTASQWTEGSYTASSFSAGTTPHTYGFAVSGTTLTISDTTGTAPRYTKESVTMPSYTKESVTLPSRTKVTVSASNPTFSGTEATITPTLTNNAVTTGAASE